MYEESEIGIRFVADGNWKKISSLQFPALELVNQNNNLNIRMWHQESSLTESEFLYQLIRKDGIYTDNKPFETSVDGCKALAIVGICNEMHRPVKVLTIVIPDFSGFNLVKIKCPDECYRDHKGQIDTLIGSIRLGRRDESLRQFLSLTCASSYNVL